MALEIISTIGIPVIIATAAIHAHAVTNLASRITSAVRAILAFMLLQLSTLLSFDMELVYILANPPVNEVANTIDLYGFRLGYQFMQMSEASALWMTQFAIQLVLTILVYLIVRRWFFRDLFHPQGDNSEGQVVHVQPNRSYMGLVIALVYSLIALVPILFLILYPFMGRGTVEAHMEMSDSPIVPAQYLLYFLLILLVVIIYMMITVTLAYPLTVKDLPGRTLYKGFLLIILSAGTSGIHEYLLYRNLGLINTIIAPVFSGMVSIIGIFVLKSIFNRNYTQLKTQASDAGKGEMYSFFVIFIPKIWKPLIALGVLQFVTIWNAYLPSLIYIHQPNLHTPTATLLPFVFRLDVEMSEMMLKLGLVVSVPALILFVIFRKWLTSEVFVNEVRK